MEDYIGIYDNYSGDAQYNQPVSSIDKFFFSKTIIILLCIEGHAGFNVRFKDYILSKNSFLIIGAGIPFYYTEKSDDFRVNIIAVADTVFDNMVQGLIRIYFQRILHERPLHQISGVKMEMCCGIHGYLRKFILEDDNFFKMQIIRNYLNILFYEACNIMMHEPENALRKDRHKEEVASKFIRLIEQKRINTSELLSRAQTFIMQLSGVSNVFTSKNLLLSGDGGSSRLRNWFFPNNCGDLVVEVSPGWKLLNEENFQQYTSKESAIPFPLIFYGTGVTQENINTPVTIDRIAPTIAKSIRIRAPNACSASPLY